jgi:AcrR family transcriptional regulator
MAPTARRKQVIDAALRVIVEQGYEGASIEAIARAAGVTRPVIYDHLRNLGQPPEAMIEREKRHALEQLSRIVPTDPGASDPIDVLAGGIRSFLDAVASRPTHGGSSCCRSRGTPAIVRDHVETNRVRALEQVQRLVGWRSSVRHSPRSSMPSWPPARCRASPRWQAGWC